MSKVIVVYKSNTGFTKRYAEWIAKELNCECVENKGLSASKLASYDTLILGGTVFAGMIGGAELIKKNYEQLKEKKMLVFACGMDEPDEAGREKMWKQNFTEDQLEKIQCFYCRGGLDFNKLKGMKKLMLKMMCKQIAAKPDKTQMEQDMVNAQHTPADFTDISRIQPIVQAARA